MNSLDSLLKQLRDIHTPEPVFWWPPAPGWWLLGLCMLGMLGLALYQMMPWLRSLRYRRAALRELAALTAIDLRAEQHSSDQLLQINYILRRTAQHAWPGQHAASRTGKAWLELLDRSADMQGFSQGIGRCLGREVYRSRPRTDVQAVHTLACRWVRRHHSRYTPAEQKGNI